MGRNLTSSSAEELIGNWSIDQKLERCLAAISEQLTQKRRTWNARLSEGIIQAVRGCEQSLNACVLMGFRNSMEKVPRPQFPAFLLSLIGGAM